MGNKVVRTSSRAGLYSIISSCLILASCGFNMGNDSALSGNPTPVPIPNPDPTLQPTPISTPTPPPGKCVGTSYFKNTKKTGVRNAYSPTIENWSNEEACKAACTSLSESLCSDEIFDHMPYVKEVFIEFSYRGACARYDSMPDLRCQKKKE